MPDQHDAPPPRRDFLARLATAGIAVTAGVHLSASTAGAAGAAGAAAGGDGAAGAAGYPADPDYDDSWTARVAAARHKAVFDAPEVADGLAFNQAWLYRQGYLDALGARAADVAPVVVLRHAGVVLAFDDAIWEKYGLGEWQKIEDPATRRPARRNPYLRSGAGVEPGRSIEELGASGVTFLACALAMNRRADQMARRAGAPPESVRAEVRAHLAPGVIVQPSGIYATARAQEVGCVFMRST